MAKSDFGRIHQMSEGRGGTGLRAWGVMRTQPKCACGVPGR